MKEKQPRSRSEKRTQARPQRQFRKEPDKQTGFTTGLTRRQLLVGGAAFVGLSALVTLGLVNYKSYFGIGKEKKEEEFSGEVEETRQITQQLQRDINEGKRTFESEIEKITDLTTAYYVSEMHRMFPSRKDQYNHQVIKGRIILLSQEEYLRSKAECKEIKSDTAETNPMTTISLKETVHVNKDYYVRKKNVGMMVHDLLHELHHLTALLKEKPKGTRILGISEEITHEKGLAALSRVNPDSDNCVSINRASMEEPVVEDSALRMAEKIDVKLSPEDMLYLSSVTTYRSVLINPSIREGGFGGDHTELLKYQQVTEPDLFFASIGKKRFPQVILVDEQIRLGTNFAIRTFSTNIYGN